LAKVEFDFPKGNQLQLIVKEKNGKHQVYIAGNYAWKRDSNHLIYLSYSFHHNILVICFIALWKKVDTRDLSPL